MSESAPTYKERAKELEDAAILDALKKIKVFHDAVSTLWSEAHSIPAGCGCTPFYSDAREGEARLKQVIGKFLKLYGKRGQSELNKLHLHYGID